MLRDGPRMALLCGIIVTACLVLTEAAMADDQQASCDNDRAMLRELLDHQAAGFEDEKDQLRAGFEKLLKRPKDATHPSDVPTDLARLIAPQGPQAGLPAQVARVKNSRRLAQKGAAKRHTASQIPDSAELGEALKTLAALHSKATPEEKQALVALLKHAGTTLAAAKGLGEGSSDGVLSALQARGTPPEKKALDARMLGDALRAAVKNPSAKVVKGTIMRRLGESAPITPGIQRIIEQVSEEVSEAASRTLAEKCTGTESWKKIDKSRADHKAQAGKAWKAIHKSRADQQAQASARFAARSVRLTKRSNAIKERADKTRERFTKRNLRLSARNRRLVTRRQILSAAQKNFRLARVKRLKAQKAEEATREKARKARDRVQAAVVSARTAACNHSEEEIGEGSRGRTAQQTEPACPSECNRGAPKTCDQASCSKCQVCILQAKSKKAQEAEAVAAESVKRTAKAEAAAVKASESSEKAGDTPSPIQKLQGKMMKGAPLKSHHEQAASKEEKAAKELKSAAEAYASIAEEEMLLPFNMTHGREKPESDGKPFSEDVWYKKKYSTAIAKGRDPARGCLTQICVSDGKGGCWQGRVSSCTSCKEGFFLRIVYHKSRAGRCDKMDLEDKHGVYQLSPKVECAKLNADEYWVGADAESIMCTKAGYTASAFVVEKIENAELRKGFQSKFGADPFAVGICQVYKVVACLATGGCTVRKSAKCMKVCKRQHNNPSKGPRHMIGNKPECYEDLCDGESGVLACRQIAINL